MVAPVPIDSSSGWAWTSSSRRNHQQQPHGRAYRCPGWQDRGMTDSFPRQQARTQGFSLGVPRSFQISPDGSRVAFLRSQGGDDPVTCLWVLDAGTGQERLVADPAKAGPAGAMTDAERAIRERMRERAAGITGFATDTALTVAAFALAGRIYLADLTGDAAPRAIPAPTRPGGGSPTSVRARCGSPTWRPARTPRSSGRAARRGSATGWPSSSRPRRWTAPGATGGRPTARPCSWPGWTARPSAAGTSPTRRTRTGPRPRSPTRRRAHRTPT